MKLWLMALLGLHGFIIATHPSLCVLADGARPPDVRPVLLLHDHLANRPRLHQLTNLNSSEIVNWLVNG